jgi:hypothetical protein
MKKMDFLEAFKKGKESISYSLASRALIKPEELLTLAEGTSIVKLLREQPAKLNQVAFWKDSSYIKGEQKIETKWNPKVFTFDVDGYYDIATRCQYDAMYKINKLDGYSVQKTPDIEFNEDDDFGDDDTTSTGGSDDDTSFTNMEIDNQALDDLNVDEWLKDADFSWDSLFEDDDLTKPTEPLATTADIVNAAEQNKGLLNDQTKATDISNLEDWHELFESRSNVNL